MWMDDPILDDLLEELDNRCTAKKNEYGTWVTICNCINGAFSH